MNGGEILLQNTPKKAIQNLAGKIWTKKIARSEYNLMELKYNILSSNYNADNSINIRVFSESQPATDFVSDEANLEDVYFMALQENEAIV